MNRRKGVSLPALSILFGPDPDDQVTKNGASAEAARREVDAMQAIAQPRSRAKEIQFGIGDPASVTDLSELFAARSLNLQSEAEKRTGYRYIGRVEMPISEWAAVSDNPRQRDTELHANKAAHLKQYDPIHRFVSMAVLPDGDRIKLDGHSRVWLWSRNQVCGPATVFVDVYACEAKDIVEDLYSKFDSQAAVETGADKIAGAARRHTLVFKSGMLRSGRYGSAVKRLYAYSTKTWGKSWGNHDFVYNAVGFYRNELALLDEVGPTPGVFPSGIIMAALATFKRRGRAVLPFWLAYAQDRGQKDGVNKDAVQALRDAVAKTKLGAKGKKGDGGQIQQLGLLGKGIIACEAYRTGQTYTVGTGGGIREKKEDALVEYLRYSAEV